MGGVFINCTKYYWLDLVYNEAVLKDDCMVRVVWLLHWGEIMKIGVETKYIAMLQVRLWRVKMRMGRV
jgi:hypothetical protein